MFAEVDSTGKSDGKIRRDGRGRSYPARQPAVYGAPFLAKWLVITACVAEDFAYSLHLSTGREVSLCGQDPTEVSRTYAIATVDKADIMEWYWKRADRKVKHTMP